MKDETSQEEQSDNDDEEAFMDIVGGGKINAEGVETLINDVLQENNRGVERVNGYEISPRPDWKIIGVVTGLTIPLTFPAYAWSIGIGILHTTFVFVLLFSAFHNADEAEERLKIIRSMQLRKDKDDEEEDGW